MTIQTFTPPRAPDPGSEDSPKIKLLEAEFGDGYTQASPDGINHIRRNMTLSWEFLSPTQALVITNFLQARGGYEPFWWTPSNESTAVKWTCKEWRTKREKGGLVTVNATFIQSFNLLT
jgi:phage-related protein